MIPSATLLLQRLKVRTHSLRFRLVIRVWIALLGCFAASNLILFSAASHLMLERIEANRSEQALYLVGFLENWVKGIETTLQQLSANASIRSLDPQRASLVLEPIYRITPYRNWRLWSADGRLISYSGSARDPHHTEQQVLRDPGFQTALRGRFSLRTSSDITAGKAEGCIRASHPVYRGGSLPSDRQAGADGVLSFCVPMSLIGRDTGLSQIAANKALMDSSQESVFDPIYPDKGDYSGQFFFLTSVFGHLIFPVRPNRDLNHVSMMSPRQVMQGPWGAFVKAAWSMRSRDRLQEVVIDNNSFFILTHRLTPEWSLVLAIDKARIFSPLYAHLRSLMLLQALTLVITTLALYYACNRVIRPIQSAGNAIKAISEGAFDTQLQDGYGGELGELYASINNTGGQLKQLLEQATAHAITDQQIHTAQRIQKSFLVATLPSAAGIDLAAFYEPAYEVGADWYDAVHLDGHIYLVVADVCDKGVASALFMGVFRTLLRYQLIYNNQSLGPEETLRKAISSVNDYIAINHGDTTMFATVFLASYQPQSREFHFISAGHEPPVWLHGSGDQPASLIDGVNGPAVGVFAESEYSVSLLSLSPGDGLVLYTDGISDARSPQDHSWGAKGLLQCLQALPAGADAAAIADHIRTGARQHIAAAPQFDDMTVLVLRIPASPGPGTALA